MIYTLDVEFYGHLNGHTTYKESAAVARILHRGTVIAALPIKVSVSHSNLSSEITHEIVMAAKEMMMFDLNRYIHSEFNMGEMVHFNKWPVETVELTMPFGEGARGWRHVDAYDFIKKEWLTLCSL